MYGPRAASRAADGAAQPSDGRLIALFSTCWRRNAGPRPTRWRRIAATLRTLPPTSRAPAHRQVGDDRGCAPLSRRARATRIAAGVGGPPPLGDPPALPLPLRRGQRSDDPAAVLEGPKRTRPLPKTPSLAEVDRLLGFAARVRPGGGRCSERLRAAAAGLPGRTPLRHRAARLRTRGACRPRRRADAAHRSSCAARASKERLVPLNDAAKRAMAEYLALRARPGRRRAAWRHDRNGCSPPSARAAISPARHFARELKALAGGRRDSSRRR